MDLAILSTLVQGFNGNTQFTFLKAEIIHK